MSEILYSETNPIPEEYLALLEATGWNQSYRAKPDELARALLASWYVVAARDGLRTVGMGRVVSDGVLYGMIYDMIVLPDHQGRGIGSAILSRLVDHCRGAGLRDVQLFSARGKASFYRQRGFIERPSDGPGMSLVNPQGNDPVENP